uniref:Uncharacterized protein n=1 Tax=Romanomermis culicivorax TaxID=13658 RepID=A0A915IXS4_ROMCU
MEKLCHKFWISLCATVFIKDGQDMKYKIVKLTLSRGLDMVYRKLLSVVSNCDGMKKSRRNENQTDLVVISSENLKFLLITITRGLRTFREFCSQKMKSFYTPFILEMINATQRSHESKLHKKQVRPLCIDHSKMNQV